MFPSIVFALYRRREILKTVIADNYLNDAIHNNQVPIGGHQLLEQLRILPLHDSVGSQIKRRETMQCAYSDNDWYALRTTRCEMKETHDEITDIEHVDDGCCCCCCCEGRLDGDESEERMQSVREEKYNAAAYSSEHRETNGIRRRLSSPTSAPACSSALLHKLTAAC